MTLIPITRITGINAKRYWGLAVYTQEVIVTGKLDVLN